MLNSALFSIKLLPGALRVNQLHRLAGQQPDNLCGPYWAAMLLQASEDIGVDSTKLALLAGSVLPIGEPVNWVPPGASSRQDYSCQLPLTEEIEYAGTSIQGLIEAVSRDSEGKYALVPLRATWTPQQVAALFTLCQNHPNWEAVPICNIETGHLWGSHLALVDAIAYLSGEDIQAPQADWAVGHFVTLAGSVEGSKRSLVLVRDTYPVLGWDGYHLQPEEAIASALQRDDGKEGGVLLFIGAKDQAEVEQQARKQGFDIAVWDNGTPMSLKGEKGKSER